MMRTALVIPALLFATVACDREPSTGPRSTAATDPDRGGASSPLGTTGRFGSSPGTRTADQSTEPSEDIAQSPDHAIVCTELIPRAVQRKYLANMTITPTSHGTDIATTCRIEGHGVHAAANIQAWCNPDEDSEPQPDKPASSSKTVGRAAILVDAGELQQLTAWDDDSNCQITMAVPKTVDAMALARGILEGLPAKPIVGSREQR